MPISNPQTTKAQSLDLRGDCGDVFDNIWPGFGYRWDANEANSHISVLCEQDYAGEEALLRSKSVIVR
jgi:hypothetical protein